MIIHSRIVVLPDARGLMPMPRKMSGKAISMMDELIVAISTPSVVLERAIHLYRGPTAGRAVPGGVDGDVAGDVAAGTCASFPSLVFAISC
jgi:hypothetical protein